MEIERLAADDRDDVRAWVGVVNGVRKHDTPWVHPLTEREAHARLAYGWDLEPEVGYLGTEDGRPVAAGSYAVSERDNRHLAWLGIEVHPDHRRRRLGTGLLAHLESEARAAGRTSAGVATWEAADCEGFGRARGYGRRQVNVNRRQHLDEVDPALVDRLHAEAATYAADYELVRSVATTPTADLAALAELTMAINDAPTDDLDIEDEVYDADRVRDYETAQRESGLLLHRLVARHRRTGALAGHTVVVVDLERPHLAEQHDTAVSPTHRGHRLGLLLKTGMLRWLREDQPRLAEIDTWNAESNDQMVGVNELLGYRVMGREMALQRDL